jgi:hypothetical protein
MCNPALCTLIGVEWGTFLGPIHGNHWNFAVFSGV